jgi:hypothetical protein
MACTVASLIPFAVKEPTKPGLFPGEFPIAASKEGHPSLLKIEGCVRSQYNENFKPIPMPVPNEVVANSIVTDYLAGQQQVNEYAGPAIFWVEGFYSVDEFEKKFSNQIAVAKERQILWFQELVKSADDVWQQHHQHKFITDLQRSAARFLNYKREWLDDSADRVTKCPACMTLVSKEAAICFACKCVLNADKYRAFTFAGAPAPATVQPVK